MVAIPRQRQSRPKQKQRGNNRAMMVTVVPSQGGGGKKKRGKSKPQQPSLPRNFDPDHFMYAKSLLDPFSGPARIPDSSTVDTDAFTLTHIFNFQTTAAGVGGLSVQPNSWYKGSKYYKEGGTTSDTAFSYPDPLVVVPGVETDVTYVSSRLVSAGIKIRFVGSTMSDGGVMSCWMQTFNRWYTEAQILSTTDLQKCRDHNVSNVRDAAYCIWKPVDIDSDAFSDGTFEISDGRVGILGVHVSGASANTPFIVELVLNYEGVRKQNSMMVVSGGNKVSSNHLVYERARLSAAGGPATGNLDSFYNSMMSKISSVDWSPLAPVGFRAAAAVGNYLLNRYVNPGIPAKAGRGPQ